MDLNNFSGVVKFSATWCQPCIVMAPVVKDICATHSIELVEVDTDSEPELTVSYGVRSIPYLVFLKEGNVVATLVGSQSKAKIEDKIKSIK